MPTTMNNIQVEDQIVLYSQLYPAVYTQMVSQQGLYFNQKQKVLSRLYIYLYLLYIYMYNIIIIIIYPNNLF